MLKNLITLSISIILGLMLVELFAFYDYKSGLYKDFFSKKINGKNYNFLTNFPEDTAVTEDTRTLYVVGDSFTAGAACYKSGRDFPRNLLKNKKQYDEVKNLGVGGLSHVDYVEIVRQIPLLRNDSILVTFYSNDLSLETSDCELIKKHDKSTENFIPSFCHPNQIEGDFRNSNTTLKKLNNYMNKFKSYTLFKEGLINIPLLRNFFFRNELRELWSDVNSEEIMSLENSIKKIINHVEGRESRAYFTYFPNVNNIFGSNNDTISSYFRHLKTRMDIKFFDPKDYFVENAPKDNMTISLTDKHPNCEANLLMAAFLASTEMLN